VIDFEILYLAEAEIRFWRQIRELGEGRKWQRWDYKRVTWHY